MKTFFALLKARNLEYYRDKGSLSWSFLFPILVIAACAIAFANPDPAVFTIGVVNRDHASETQQKWLDQHFIKVKSPSDRAKALSQIQHHQLDLLVDYSNSVYWINSDSSRGDAIEQLLLPAHTSFKREPLRGNAIRYVDWVIPGVLGMNLMFGSLFGIGYVIVRYRQNGVLKRLKATPVTAFEFLSAQLISRLLIVVVINALIFIGCAWILDIVVLGSYLDLLLITALGALAMIAIGLLISSRTSNEELAGGLLNFATWPMLFLSEVWFPLDEAPQWMQQLAQIMPLTHLVKANRAIMLDGASLLDVSYHMIWLVVITAIGITAAAALFRWTRN